MRATRVGTRFLGLAASCTGPPVSDELRCPSCAEPLVGLEEGDESSGLGDSAGSLACSGCGGVFIPGSSVDGDLPGGAATESL